MNDAVEPMPLLPGVDVELRAIRKILDALETLDVLSQRRVMRYVDARIDAASPQPIMQFPSAEARRARVVDSEFEDVSEVGH